MKQTIYVKLLDEGVDVWRPAMAEKITDGDTFMILPPPFNIIPSGEHWEFGPGTYVLTKEITLDGDSVRVAYKEMS